MMPKGYWQVSVICEGALDEDRELSDIAYPLFLADVEGWANAHSDLDVEVYAIWHEHRRGVDCECIQYVTDHHPAAAWGPLARASA